VFFIRRLSRSTFQIHTELVMYTVLSFYSQ